METKTACVTTPAADIDPASPSERLLTGAMLALMDCGWAESDSRRQAYDTLHDLCTLPESGLTEAQRQRAKDWLRINQTLGEKVEQNLRDLLSIATPPLSPSAQP